MERTTLHDADPDTLARLAVERGLISAADASACLWALREAPDPERTLPLILVERGLASGDALARLWDSLPGSPSAPRLAAGTRLGRFALHEVLGRGGMGVVYRAVDEDLGRELAIKVLPPTEDLGPERQLRFEREAALAARLSHPGLVRIHQAGTQILDGEPVSFIAMDLIRGRSLAELRGELSTEARLDVLEAVAQAVGHAHAQGVVHRDLKPANILVADRDGRPVVTDFGLARDVARDTRLTATGAQLGTPAYMAPEQLLGEASRIGPWTDVWALGVVLYELVSGRRPFGGQTSAALSEAILGGPPPPLTHHAPEAPPGLVAVVAKALAAVPEQRYPTASALAADLARARAGGPTDASRPRSGRWLIAGLAALALVLVTLGWGIVARRRAAAFARHRASALSAEARADWAAVRTACASALALRADPTLAALAGRAAVALEARKGAAAEARLSQAVDPVLDRLARTIEATRPLRYRADIDFRRTLTEVEAALADLQALLARSASARRSARAWSLLGRGWFIVGDVNAAETALLKAVARAPTDAAAHRTLTRIYLRRMLLRMFARDQPEQVNRMQAREWAERAREHLRRAVSRWDGGTPLDRLVVEAYRALADHRTERVLTLCNDGLERFGDDPGTEELWHLAGFVAPGDAERRVAWRRAVARCPHDGWLWFVCAMAEAGDARASALDRAIALDPYLAAAVAARGDLRYQRGEHVAALADHERACVLEPKQATHRRACGLALTALGRPADALAAYDQAVALDPEWVDLRINRGLLRFHQGRLDGAEADLRRALALAPDSAMAHNNLGLVAQARGDRDAATRYFTRAIELDPTSADAFNNRAVERKRRGDLQGALADYGRALSLEPKRAKARFNRALTHLALGDREAADADLTAAIALAPGLAPSWSARGDVRRGLGRPKAALADLDRAIALDPKLASAYVSRGSLRRQMGDANGARADLDRAIALDPRDPVAWYNRANLRGRQGDGPGALSDYARSLTLDPRQPSVHYNRALLRLRGKDVDGALADLDRALALAPRHRKAYVRRAAVRRSRRDWAGALRDLDRALALAPAAREYLDRARVRMMRKELPAAIDDCNRARRLEPRNWEPPYSLAILLVGQRRFEEARAALRDALALAPPASQANIRARLADIDRFERQR